MSDPSVLIALCGHCGNESPQELVAGWGEYALLACKTCEECLLYRGEHCFWLKLQHHDQRLTVQSFFNLDVVWPEATQLPTDAPPSVANVYREAISIKHRSPNGFAGQIRRALEAVCKDRAASGRTLQDKLRHLADGSVIPPVLLEMSEALRLIGNVGSHADEVEVLPEFVEPIDSFFRAIVEYVYTAPSRVAEFQEKLKKAKEPMDFSDL